MRSMKLYPNRIAGILILLVIVIITVIVDLSTEFMYFLGALTFLLVYAIPDYIRFRQFLKSREVVLLKSTDWLSPWPLVALAIYWLSNKDFNFLNITAISIIVIYGVIESIRNYRKIYSITDQAIVDLDNRKLIDASDITEIETIPDGLVIHTTKYRNDFEFKSASLITPSWDELIEKVDNLNHSAKNEMQ